MEEKVSSTMRTLEGELKGTYYSLTGMDKKTQQRLIDDHFLFKEGDRFLQATIASIETKRSIPPRGRNVWGTGKKTRIKRTDNRVASGRAGQSELAHRED
ncbi:hypothetical protein IscW_ISCW013005 [Ixodes scapularis]|uniref:arginine kinase n=1 Tax=Ixodes scapularis TaxID=6945 RepID=B7QFQ1_IXOSC|nr:hypothetical protein IscW_ISCW013005 [Ixodes scapularis]|eukprot:XP_002414365.1 hypothetical protein IscW_ISCW013005 [Ixodes scapularis]